MSHEPPAHNADRAGFRAWNGAFEGRGGGRRESWPGSWGDGDLRCRVAEPRELAESYLTPTLFRRILGLVEQLEWHPT